MLKNVINTVVMSGIKSGFFYYFQELHSTEVVIKYLDMVCNVLCGFLTRSVLRIICFNDCGTV